MHRCGTFVREAGQAMDRVGCFMQGSIAYKETLNRHRRIMGIEHRRPELGKEIFIAPSAAVIGGVKLGSNSSVWYNAVVRGDVADITVGEKTNLQDRVIVHVAGSLGKRVNTHIGNLVTVEAGAIIHACTLEDETYIGMGATILDKAVISKHSMIAPGSVVVGETVVPSGELWAGTPAKFLRKLTEEEKLSIAKMAEEMCALAKVHMEENNKEFESLLHEMERIRMRDDRLVDYNFINQ